MAFYALPFGVRGHTRAPAPGSASALTQRIQHHWPSLQAGKGFPRVYNYVCFKDKWQ